MLKNITGLECNIENKIYHFTCDCDAPLNHIKEALFQFMKYIGRVEDAAKAKQEEEKSSKIEVIKEEKSEQAI